MIHSTDNQNSEKKKSASFLEKALIASEIRYRRLFESAKDGILILDAQTGMIVDVNPFLIELLGYSKESFIEKTIWGIGFFKDIIDNKDKFLELQRDKYVRYEDLPLETADGRKINVEFVSNVYLEDDQKVIQCNIREITKRKEMEAGLEKTRKELAELKEIADEESILTENIINTVREPLLVLDEELRVIKASSSFYNFFKVSPENTIGRLIYELGNHQWDIPKLRELLEKILPEKTTFDDYEVEHNFSSIGRHIMLLNARQIKRRLGKEKIILLAFKDVTERRGVERSLSEKSRLNNEYLNILLNHAHTPIITWDSSLLIKRFNLEFEKLSGYNKSEVQDKKIEMLFPKKEVTSTLKLIRNNIDNENPKVIELNILTKNNEIRTVLWNSANISDEEGQNTVATIAQDITSRKRSEEALINSEIRYRRLFESAKDGVLILNAKTGMIVDVNPFLLNLLGYSKKNFTQKAIWEIGFLNDIVQNKEKFLKLLQNESVRYEDLPLETANGRKIHVEFVSNVYLVDRQKVIQCNIRDITERKEAFMLLHEREEQYRSVVQSATDAIITADNNGLITAWNQRAEKIFGFTENEIIGENVDKIMPKTYDISHKNKLRNIEQGGAHHLIGKTVELVGLHKNGTEFPLELSLSIWEKSSKKFFTGIIRDITERKQMEEVLRQKTTLLEAQLNSSIDGIIVVDNQGKKILQNQRTIDLWKIPQHIADNEDDHLQVQHVMQMTKNPEMFVRKITDLYEHPDISSFDDVELVDGTVLERYSAPVLDKYGQNYGRIWIFHDVTERKRAEEILIENEAKYRTLVTQSPDGIFIMDISGTFLSVNKTMCENLKYSEEEFLSMKLWDIIPQKYKPLHRSRIADILKGERKNEAAEYEVKGKDGIVHYIEVLSAPYYKDKVIIGFQGIARDITEKKRAEETIRSLAKFPSESPNPVLRISKEGRLLFANEASNSSFTWKLEMGKPAPAVLQNIVNDAFKQKKFLKIEIEINKRIFSVHAVPIFESNYTNLYMQDITKRKLDEKEITMLAHALKSVKECVSITDLEDKIIFVNESFLETYGYPRNELIGENINKVRSQKNEAKMVAQILPDTLKGGWNDELWNKRKDGSEFQIYLSTTIIIDNKGNPIGLIGVASDITEHKRFEQELIRAKEKAEESDRLKSAFLATMSHEIRTPLNGIFGFTELLKEPNIKSDDIQDYIQIIQISGARLLNTINNIVDISKIESGLVQINISETNINEKMEFTYKFFKPETESKGLHFSLKNGLTTKESIIKTDNEKVYGILTNLVKNAIKFTYVGSINFGYTKKGEFLEFFIKDTGVGIPENHKNFIFERFRQGSESYNRGYEGSGLGLSIAKSYVELLGGKMWVESQEGKGSTFYFTIPYIEASDKNKETINTEYKEVQLKKLKILIVDDDEISYSLLTLMLHKISKKVLHATSGVEAIEACRNNPDLDLVLMDIRMPAMDGNEATRNIRKFNKDIIIIAQTAYAFAGDKEKAIEAGSNDYISKPIKKDLLLELIKKHCKGISNA